MDRVRLNLAVASQVAKPPMKVYQRQKRTRSQSPTTVPAQPTIKSNPGIEVSPALPITFSKGKEVKVSIPDLPGVRFRPDDCEVLYFLKDKLLGRLELPPGLIQENIDPYIYDPMELPKGDGFKRDKKAFFFTNKKENKTTKDGFWGHTTTEHIFDHDHILGLKKELVFSWAIQNQIIKTNWVSHEYSISPAIFSDEERRSIGEKIESYVVCGIHYKFVDPCDMSDEE